MLNGGTSLAQASEPLELLNFQGEDEGPDVKRYSHHDGLAVRVRGNRTSDRVTELGYYEVEGVYMGAFCLRRRQRIYFNEPHAIDRLVHALFRAARSLSRRL